MAVINIEIENCKLKDMGINQEPIYVPLYFKESSFIGYWISTTDPVITFYLGSQSFLCHNNEKNIKILESLL